MVLGQKTVSATLYRWLLAERQGYDRHALSRAISIDERIIDAPRGRVSGDKHVRLLKLTENWPLTDEALRPDVAVRLWPFPELAGVVCNSGTLREALWHYVKYRDLIGNVDWVLVQETSDRMAFDYVLEGVDRATSCALGNFATLAGIARFYDPSSHIGELRITGAPLDRHASWNETFRTRVTYYQSHNQLVLFSNRLDERFERFNGVLAGIQQRAATCLREQIRDSGSFAKTVAQHLRDWLHDGSNDQSTASLQQRLCDELEISRWTLLRRLRAEDVPFQDLLIQARMGEARALLLHTSLPISEIADRVHFGSISAFSRFFTRTAGMAPSRFRAEKWHASTNDELA
ncbi:HTH-type transcriptional activator RhaR [Pararobbsia alpina]|uniref:HTH-type transcriptional activator RhaR n=2 Tax=Pararobbsia alpina TaxID=621374 RepID=A0A6S7CLM2_9BURK|nr:HTH-type transcriptional activator RhaR [Pararobbsia alpina]